MRSDLVRAGGPGPYRWCVLLAGVAGLAASALGDDDDQKLRDLRPPVLRSIWRNPDAWKLMSMAPPVADPGDATFPSKNIELITWVPVNNFPGYSGSINNQSGADCWGYTSSSGREYALMCVGWGTSVVEVTDPANPVFITTIPGADSLWHDVTVVGDYAYAVSDQSGPGIQVIDLSNVDAGQATLVRNYSQGGHSTTHTIVSNPDSGYLYLCGGNAANGGMVPASTTDPTFPVFTGGGWTTQYVHEAQIVSYDSGPYDGKEIAFLFAAGPYYNGLVDGLAIADVTDKNNVQTLSFIRYPGLRFCHQGWITDDRKYLYINDELDSPGSGNVPRFLCRVFDIQDLTNPRLITTFNNGLPAIDHNEYAVGRYLYQSNYTSGFRVWDIFDPLRPVEVAYIDTRPEDDGTAYNGAWGNYPYFASGTLLISDIQRGLFVAKLSLLEYTPIDPLPTTLTPDSPTPISITLAQKNATFVGAQLMVSVNGGAYTASPMTLDGTTLSGVIPAASCGDRVRYYVTSTDADSESFTWPLRGESDPIVADVQTGSLTVFEDNFESDQGWTIQNTSVSTGAWVRVTPLDYAGQGAVIGDGDGSGKCWVTGSAVNVDLDGGPTRLLSPVLDLSGAPEARVSYDRWLLSITGDEDSLVTEVSNDNGANWVAVDTVTRATGGWRTHNFRVADYVAPTSEVRVRFSAQDSPNNSTTEAGIDGFRVTVPECVTIQSCYANCDESTTSPVLNVADFTCFLNRFAAGDSYANCDQSTTAPVLNVADFTCFLNSFASGCP